MARDSTPVTRKRSRPGNDENEDPLIPSSTKKRRLEGSNGANTSAPRTLHAIASAISGAFGFGRRTSTSSLQFAKELDKTYEVPDSDEEREKSKSKKRLSEPKASSHKKNSITNDIYDIPDSGDELSVAPPSQKSQNRTTPSKKQNDLGRESRKSSRQQRRGRTGKKAQNDEDAVSENDTSADESPLKPHSGSKSGAGTAEDKEDDELEPLRDESHQDATPSPARTSGRRKKNPLDNLVIDGTPKLKGILTPSRRNRDSDRPTKSVAFDSNGAKEKGEVYFADLLSKAPKPKLSSKGPADVSAVEIEPEDDEDAAEESEEDEEAEEICTICSKPDSEPPNEIIFCDNCDMAVHQECYDIPVVPDGDWLCLNCAQEDIASNSLSTRGGKIASEDKPPDVPNFEQHLRSLQRVLLDRCTGRRAIKLRGQDEAYDKTFQLVEQTVMAGEGNSMLIIGARGCGKTAMVESIISSISSSYKGQFHVVRLSGFIHTDDKLALKEIWRQLGKEMEVEDELVRKTNNYADTLASLLALLSHPSEIAESEDGVTSKSVVFVIDEFDLFATHGRQTLLYNLFDIAQARKAPIAVLGLTTRIDVVESLEKRVKSRFSHRYVYLSLPKSLPAYWDVCRQGLTVDDEDMKDEGLDPKLKGHSKFHGWWNKKIEELHNDAAFQAHLEFCFYGSKSVSAFLTTCALPLASLSPTSLSLKIPSGNDVVSLEPPDSKLHLLQSLSDLDLSLLIAAARLDIVAHTDTVNFAMAYDEYTSLMGKQRVQSASAGMMVIGGGSRVWGRGVAGIAWERLAILGLLIPAGLGGRGVSGHSGLEAKMWKLDVALEEIPVAVRLGTVLAKWCKDI